MYNMPTNFYVNNLKKIYYYKIGKTLNMLNTLINVYKNLYKKNTKCLNIMLKKIFFYKSSSKDSAKIMMINMLLKYYNLCISL